MSLEKKQRNSGLNSLRQALHLPIPGDVEYHGLVDQTNVVHLRTRKTKSHPNASSLLQKMARAGQYDVSLQQFPALRTSDLTAVPSATDSFPHKPFAKQRTGPTSESRRKVDISVRDKVKKFAWKRRKVDSNLPYPASPNTTSKTHTKLSLRSWRAKVLSHVSDYPRNMKAIKKLVWNGVPSSIRGEVWSKLIGNHLNIDKTLYNQCLRLSDQNSVPLSELDFSTLGNGNHSVSSTVNTDCPTCAVVFANFNPTPIRQELCFSCPHTYIDPLLTVGLSPFVSANSRLCLDRSVCLRSAKKDLSRTFHTMRLFQPGCPFHTRLHNLLAAFVMYQPRIGYLPGMSYLAAVLLLAVPDVFDSFVLFANILDKPCHRAFYNPDESEFVVYFRAFNQLLADRVPRLYAHFVQVGVEPNMYLFDWVFTIFSRVLPLEAALRVWDVYCAEGDIILFRVALTLLLHFQRNLVRLSFDQLVSFLTNRLPLELTGDQLMKLVYSVRLKRSVWAHYLVRAQSVHGLDSTSHNKTFSFALRTPKHLPSSNSVTCRNTPESTDFKSLVSHDIATIPALDPKEFRPGLVDHSIRSLYSPGSTVSIDLLEEKFERTDKRASMYPDISEWIGTVDWDSGQRTPWTVEPHASPFHANVFTFDELPSSAPPVTQIRSPKDWRFSRWSSDWVLSELDNAESTKQNARSVSSHDFHVQTSCSPLPRRAASLHHIKAPLFHRSHSKQLTRKPNSMTSDHIVSTTHTLCELVP